MKPAEGKRPEDPLPAWVSRHGLALLTDLYELTMFAGYLETGIDRRRACFEYFFRELPPHTGFAVFAGLDGLLHALESFRFNRADLDYLRGLKLFSKKTLDRLAGFRPELDLFAPPEGSIVFPHEPIVRVEGPLADAQLIETMLLNLLNYPTLIATRAARVSLAALGDPVMEFGLRRAQGPDGGLSGSRAAYIGGCGATSNMLAGKAYGIPVRGTHAHSWIMSHPSELEAFRQYAKIFPDSPILLVDTYDTLASGVPNAIRVFKELRQKNPDVRAAIRLDSGDLARLSKEAWKMLVAAGFSDPLIVGSGDLDEDLIADLKRQGAKINSWGVGTHLITCKDYPALGGVYKITAMEEGGKWRPRIKLSSNPAKTTDPGRKQVFRLMGEGVVPQADVLVPADESPRPGRRAGVDRLLFYERRDFRPTAVQPLLEKVMAGGKRLGPAEPTAAVRERAQAGIRLLPEELKRLRNPDRYPVLLSPGLAAIKERMMKKG